MQVIKTVNLQIDRDDIRRLKRGEAIELREGEILTYAGGRVRVKHEHVEANGKPSQAVDEEVKRGQYRKFKCPDCGKRLRSANGYGPHKRKCPARVESPALTAGVTRNRERREQITGKFECPVCMRAFNSIQGRNAHLGQIHRGWRES